MSNLLKPGECMSHGRIMRIQKEESKCIQDQINEFFGHGGKVEKIETGKTGVKEGAKYKFSI